MKKILAVSLVAACSLFATTITFNEARDDATRVNPEETQGVILSYNSSISEAKKSVVNISTTKTSTVDNGIDQMFNDPFFRDFFGFNFRIPQDKQKTTSLGSGVIISNDGYIVTNNHVIEDSDEIVVTLLEDDQEYKAKVIGTDPKTDLAIIKIDAKNLKAIKIADSSKIMEGDIVFAIGNPFGVGGSITQGIISGLNKDNIGLNQYENFIQTDASINPGNSGGALVDSRGALVGINSAILSRSGGNNGIGFAIPSNMTKEIAKKLIEDGKIERGYIGVMIANLTTEQKEIYKNKEGALISSVEKGLPADAAGLKRGDLVIQIDDKRVKNANDLKNIIGSLAPDKEITVNYERSGKIESAKIKLANTQQTGNTKGTSSIEGLSVTSITDDIRYKYKIPQDIVGVLVTDIKTDSKADKFGFKKGDIIIQIGEENIKNIDDFNKALSNSKNKKTLVWVNRGGIIQGLVIK
ncbi:Do family serine endopeptidase [Campylobacter sp. CCUG 57310]|uniref:Do family serine endopeptidase n=1 Tax=Campylobacter sp. CCUG 57310 TaxID=2517362 RepID=UPI00156486AA|nr:Do family serine endopeptidase [Campylobacter sp. CCUG 57310]QKF92092.1 periplasmic heat shock serine protease HtrA, Do family [Campylobacter sp. CCUG 57310]